MLAAATIIAGCASRSNQTDLICVKFGTQWGFINKKGQYVINPQFDYAGEFLEGLAMVEIGKKRGVINKSGEYVANPVYEDLCVFISAGIIY